MFSGAYEVIHIFKSILKFSGLVVSNSGIFGIEKTAGIVFPNGDWLVVRNLYHTLFLFKNWLNRELRKTWLKTLYKCMKNYAKISLLLLINMLVFYYCVPLYHTRNCTGRIRNTYVHMYFLIHHICQVMTSIDFHSFNYVNHFLTMKTLSNGRTVNCAFQEFSRYFQNFCRSPDRKHIDQNRNFNNLIFFDDGFLIQSR